MVVPTTRRLGNDVWATPQPVPVGFLIAAVSCLQPLDHRRVGDLESLNLSVLGVQWELPQAVLLGSQGNLEGPQH